MLAPRPWREGELFRNETEWVRWLRARLAEKASGLKLGIGDDAALVRWKGGYDLVFKTDMSVEGIHFSSRLHPPRSVGFRALARPLSDVAAMGGTPRFALISLALSRQTQRTWLEGFYKGVSQLARRFAVAVAGGDTTLVRGRTMMDVAVVGEIAEGEAIARSGARPGDQVFVSGQLGLSALGLEVLKGRVQTSDPRSTLGRISAARQLRRAVQAHLYPEPRLELGRYLAKKTLASALIDVSDGLSTDLHHLSEASGVGARVSASRLPKPAGLLAAGLREASALELALHGGEDYELLFTVPPRKVAQIPSSYRAVPLTRIGEICGSKEVLLELPDGTRSRLEPGGFDHFRGRRFRE